MKQHNILLLTLFVATIQSMATTHAMVRAGAAQAVQSAARSVQSMGALRMATSVQAVQQVVGRQAAHTFGVRNVMNDALSGVSKNSRRSPEKPKIEAFEQEAFGAKQKKPDAQQEKIGEKASQQSSVQDLIKAMGACSRDAYAGLRGCTKKAEDVGLLAYQRYTYGKSMVHKGYADGKSVVYKNYESYRKPVLLLTGAVGLSAGAVGMHELAKYKLKADPDNNWLYSLLVSDKECLNIIMNRSDWVYSLDSILDSKSAKDRRWRMVTNNIDIILTKFFSTVDKKEFSYRETVVINKLLKNGGTKKTAVAVLSNSIYLIGVDGGQDVLRFLLNHSEYKDAAGLILYNQKLLVQASPKEQLKVELQKHGVSAAAVELIVGRMPERAPEPSFKKS